MAGTRVRNRTVAALIDSPGFEVRFNGLYLRVGAIWQGISFPAASNTRNERVPRSVAIFNSASSSRSIPSVLTTRIHRDPSGRRVGSRLPEQRVRNDSAMIEPAAVSASRVPEATWNDHAWRPLRVVAVIQAWSA